MRQFVSAMLMITCCVAGCWVAASAADPVVNPKLFTLDKLEEAGKHFRTMRVAFTQEKHLAILDEPVINKGVLEINRDLGAVRWEFTGRSVLIFKDDKLRRFGAEGKEETVAGGKDPSIQTMATQMRSFLDGKWGGMQELFVITPDPDGAPELTFTPRSQDLKKYLTKLVIRFRDDLSAPQSMLMIANGDDRTEYRFERPEVDIEIPSARFSKP
jgi:hypothetical protein